MLRILNAIFLLPGLLLAQVESFDELDSGEGSFKNQVFKPNIQSVDMFLFPDPMSPPVMYLNSGNSVVLSFDDLSMEMHELNYTITHCDNEWKASNLDYYRYADGLEEGYITDYNYSRAMNQRYIHYTLKIPNDQIKIRASGNYIVKVYKNNNPKDLLLTWRFYVAENEVNIKMDVHRAFDPEFRFSKQEVDFTVGHAKMTMTNPTQTIKVKLLQNWRWDNAKTNLKPNFIGPNELTYNYEEENTFWGGNEQRFINISNFDLKSENVEGFIKRPDTVHVFTTKEKPKSQHTLIDRNTNWFGKRSFGLTGGGGAGIDPDYALVYFYILSEYPEAGGDFYVFGELSNWEFSEPYKMVYNQEKKRYECSIYLKQGFYNWQYLFVNSYSQIGDPRPVEGSFSETLNSYTVLVYYKGVTEDYDRLIGIRTVEYPTINFEER